MVILRKQFELSYYGNAGSYSELDRLPKSEFTFFYEMLKDSKKKEKQEREKAERRSRERARAARVRSPRR